MGFTVDADLEDLRASVRAVLESDAPTEPGDWRATWATAVELGWPAVGLPEADGGLGLGQVGVALMLEATGRSRCPVVLSTAGLAGTALGQVGPEPQAAATRARIARGAAATLAMGATAGVEVVLGALHGTADVVTDASRAELFVVVATRDRQAVLAVVEASDPRVRVAPLAGPDVSTPIGSVQFDGAVPGAIVPVDAGTVVAACRTSVAADLIGGAQRSLELAVAYASARQQFGRAIGEFQGVKHPLADVYVGIERARSLTYAAAVLIDDPGADPQAASRHAAMAKAAASEAALAAAKVGIQTFGAMGTTWENDLPRHLGRARQGFALFGTPRDLYLELAAG